MKRYVALTTCAALLLLTGLAAAQTASPSTCTVTKFTVPNLTLTAPEGINGFNTVTGVASSPSPKAFGQAFIRFSDGTYKVFTNFHSSILRKRNSSGTTVGSFFNSTGGSHGWILSGSTSKTFDYPGKTNTDLFGINKYGTIVGTYNQQANGFKLKSGVLSSIHFPNSTTTVPFAISDTGVIVGRYTVSGDSAFHGFVLANGVYKKFDAPGAATLGSYATDVNASGEIVGVVYTSNGLRGYIYKNGTFTIYNVPNATMTEIFGVNNVGTITGDFTDATFENGGFIRQCQ